MDPDKCEGKERVDAMPICLRTEQPVGVDDDDEFILLTSREDENHVLEKIFLEANQTVLQFLLFIFFTRGTDLNDAIFKKWASNIDGSSADKRRESLRRLMRKISSCRGCLELGDQYVKIFDEGTTNRAESSELHLPGDISNFAILQKPLSILKRFFDPNHENTDLILNHKTSTHYYYSLYNLVS